MAQLGDVRRAAFGSAQGAQYYRNNLLGMTAAERHKKLVNDYLTYYARGSDDSSAKESAPIRTDADALREHHRFIRSDADDDHGGWEARLAKRYYDRLFKEYAIVDLSYYKQSKLGMRWRTQKEVMSGKGQFVCGAKGCEAGDGLCSYEVNFAYQEEAGERKQALVKLRVCPGCAFKLNYRKEKQLQKAADAAAARKRKREQEQEQEELAPRDPLVRQALEYVQRFAQGGEDEAARAAAELERAAGDVAPPPAAAAAAGAAGDGGSGSGPSGGGGAGVEGQQQQQLAQPAVITLPADNSVWESKPAQEAVSVEEEMDAYFEGLFL